MIFSNITYNGITFSRFVRGSGFQAEVVTGDRIAIRSTRDPLPAQDGIQRYIDYYGSRLLEIRGWVKGTSESDLYDNITTLASAFDIHGLESSGNYGFLALEWTDPGQNAARYYVKPLNNTLVVSEERKGLARGFSVLLEAKDPVKYSATTTAYTLSPNTSTGSSKFPFAFPVAFGGTTNYGDTVVTNSGSVAVLPAALALTGPSSGTWTAPKITNLTSGEYLGFSSSVTLSSGESISVNFATATATKVGTTGNQTDITPYLTTGSTFWTVSSGSSTIRIEGASMPVTSYATITITSSF